MTYGPDITLTVQMCLCENIFFRYITVTNKLKVVICVFGALYCLRKQIAPVVKTFTHLPNNLLLNSVISQGVFNEKR